MAKPTHPVYRGPWQRIRRTILERDNHTCQIAGPKCTGTATHVDHIIPINQGGPWYDPTNLRATCPTCNYARIDRQRKENWRTAPTHITLIVGPPPTNKHQHLTHATPDDLIIDYDTIASSLTINGTKNQTLHKAAETARAAIIRALRAGDIKVGRAWILSSHPDAETLFPHHKVIVADPGLEAAVAEVRRTVGVGREGDQAVARVQEWYGRRNGSRTPSVGSRQW